jgi:aryl-alcohol dehydrogenase-like predicted oxidoreductase
MEALSLLVESGKVRYVGVSNFSIEQMVEARRYLPIVTNQVEYSLLDRNIEKEMIPYAENEGMSILPYKVLGRGILTGKLKEVPRFEKGDWRSEEDIFKRIDYFELWNWLKN